MTDHWANSMDWDSHQGTSISEDPPTPINPVYTSMGSYHCKSAIRSHDSNMKLLLYKRSYKEMHETKGAPGYTEESLLIISDLWRCFYKKDRGLDRVLSRHDSLRHATCSVAFARWADYTISDLYSGDEIDMVLNAEGDIWQMPLSFIKNYKKAIHGPAIDHIRRITYLIYFLNYSLIVMNHTHVPSRPDIDVLIPGICDVDENGIYTLKYNDYLHLDIKGQCVRLVTPVFDQILHKDLFLTICDKMNERLNVIIGSSIIQSMSRQNPGDPSVSDDGLLHKVIDIIDWGDNVIIRHRNRGFDLLSKFEAYCVSAMLRHDDPDIWDIDEFQRNLLTDDMSSQPDLYEDAMSLCTLLESLDLQQLAEVHGLWRIWGHPIIDLEGGMKKMETTCLKQPNVSIKETQVGVRTFKLTFSLNYFKKHHHYPLSNMIEPSLISQYQDILKGSSAEDIKLESSKYDDASYVHRCLRTNKLINDRNSLYRHEDWDTVTLHQCFQIPQSLNLATMIKDKAISMTRSELIDSVTYRHSVFDSTKRRGVLKWLSEQTYRLKEYLWGIDATGLPTDDCIIGLYPKEREMKTKARFFSLMSYNMRMYITATEELLGKYLLPYFPMITMSDTLLNMVIRLYNMTTSIGADGAKVTYSMNIDFSKWNQNMRERTNDGIFSTIDRILGFKRLISRTHDIFRSSYLYLCSGEYIPQIIQGQLTAMSPYSRIGDESGKEGLRQKGWTITTVCDILSLAFLHKVKIELIGGGDNQVLTVTISSPIKDSKLSTAEQLIGIRNRMTRFRNALAKKMDKRGLPLKLEETWISHRLLMYNKIMYLDGVPLKGRLKVISRMFSNSNEGISTIGSIMSTLGTGFQSLSAKDYSPLLAWVLSRLLLHLNLGQFYIFNPITGSRRLDKAILLARENHKAGRSLYGAEISPLSSKRTFKEKSKFTTSSTLSMYELYMVCLYYHKILGGPGIGSPLSYIMKGFPDPLSEALTFNYKVLNRARNNWKYYSAVDNLTTVESSAHKHWEHLLEDPVSINHNAPAHGIAALRTQAESIMRNADIQNRAFKELIAIGDNKYLRDLSEKLCSADMIEPRLLHDIVGATIPGYVNTILSKVDQSTTLNKLAGNSDVILEVYTSEMLYMIYLADKIKIKRGYERSACPTSDSRMLRNLTWGKSIVGVTTPHPAAFLTMMKHTSASPFCDQNYISVLSYRACSQHDIKRGRFRPYFGSYTEEKFKGGIMASAYGDEDILKRALRIQKLLGWRYQKGSYMYTLIQSILSCVTDSDPDKFLPSVEEITGDVEHRYQDMATKHGGIPTNLVQLYTHVSCNTSTFIDHSKGSANESLHFQASIIYSSLVGILNSMYDLSCSTVYHLHESCNECIKPIETPPLDNDDIGDVSLISCPTNDLMYIEENDIPTHYHTFVAFLRDQEKRSWTEKEGDIVKEIQDGELRGSWLLLLAASLLSGGTSIKRSALKLHLGTLVIEEVAFLFVCLIRMEVSKTKLPVGQWSVITIKQICISYPDLVISLITVPIFTEYIRKHNLPPIRIVDSMIDAESLHVVVQEMYPLGQLDMTTSVIKYQDPFFSISRFIRLTAINPTTVTCAVCSDIINKLSQDTVIKVCGIHGTLNTACKYHLYSLDKLSKTQGGKNHGEWAQPDKGIKRKRGNRKGTLFSSMQLARELSGKKKTMRRAKSILYEGDISDDLCEILSPDWSSTRVSSEDHDQLDGMCAGVNYIPDVRSCDPLPKDISYLIQFCQGAWCAVQHCIADKVSHIDVRARDHTSLEIALDIPLCPWEAHIIGRAMQMMNSLAILNNSRKIKIHIFVSNKSQLEDTDLSIITSLCSDFNNKTCHTDEKRIYLTEDGDNVLDLLGIVRGKDAVLLTPMSDFQMLSNEKIYVLTDDRHAYSCLSVMEGAISQVLRYTIMMPTVCIDGIRPTVIFAEGSPEHYRISSSAVVGALCDLSSAASIRQCPPSLIPHISVSHESVARSIYRVHVRIMSGVTNREDVVTICAQLAEGLYNSALSSHERDPMNWKSVLIIQMIIAVRILADSDAKGAMTYYSKFQHMSYRLGSYREVILHQGCNMDTPKGYFVNMTRGSLGESLFDVLEDMRGWLSVLWTGEIVRSRVIII